MGTIARSLLVACLAGCGPEEEPGPDPGWVTLHRLNRTEYNNTVRDLLGTGLRPADDFPSDDSSFGFDNIASVLSISPLQAELYRRAAELLATEALRQPGSTTERFAQADFDLKPGITPRGSFLVLGTLVDVGAPVKMSQPGRYRIAVRAYQDPAGLEPAQMGVLLGDNMIKVLPVPATAEAPAVYETLVDVSAGARYLSLVFLNDYYDVMNRQDRNLAIEWIAVEGPLDAPAKNPARGRILRCDPREDGEEACARQIIAALGRRAWRRPLSEEELDALGALAAGPREDGEGFEAGVALAVQAILLSPHFLFRVELDPEDRGDRAHRLSDHELAARLSYLLWSSMPDEALDRLADAGALRDGDVLLGEVDRMLGDPRADALLDNFFGQWLATRALAEHRPDSNAFPAWSEELRRSMAGETRLFLGDFLRGGAGLDQLLTAPSSYVDATLARHYGVQIKGEGFQRVALPPGRRGLLTQGSVLTLSSYPTRTSPVRRGKWVLDRLLCSPPAPPPPGIVADLGAPGARGSLRERLEAHRKDPACAGCHARMDPIGLGLERFDGIGALRSEDNGVAVDASGQLEGAAFDGADQLSALLAADPRLPACAVRALFTYALGRAPQGLDDERLAALSAGFRDSGQQLRALLARIVENEAFRRRRREPEPSGDGGEVSP